MRGVEGIIVSWMQTSYRPRVQNSSIPLHIRQHAALSQQHPYISLQIFYQPCVHHSSRLRSLPKSYPTLKMAADSNTPSLSAQVAAPELGTKPSLLDLPAEMRIAIYSFIGPTQQSFRYSDYRGLYFSCKMIHREMDAECPKQFQDKLEDLQKRPSVILLDAVLSDGRRSWFAPTKFSHLSTIRIDVHIEVEKFPTDLDLPYSTDSTLSWMTVAKDLLTCSIQHLSLRFHTNQIYRSSDWCRIMDISKDMISDLRKRSYLQRSLESPGQSPLQIIMVDVEHGLLPTYPERASGVTTMSKIFGHDQPMTLETLFCWNENGTTMVSLNWRNNVLAWR